MEIIRDESNYNMFDWWKKVVSRNYANFEGRARRSEYWYFVLFNFVVTIGVYMLIFLTAFIGAFLLIPLLWLFNLAIFIPHIAVGVRRLHDTGKSGWFILLGLIPLAGAIILIVFFATEGDPGDNEYGPDPKLHGRQDIHKIGTE